MLHAQVCALERLHALLGRDCPCERMSHAHVCVRQYLHTLSLVACPNGQVCARQRLHALTLVARPKTTPRRQRRLAPASVYPTVGCVHVSAYTPLLARLALQGYPAILPRPEGARGK